MVVSNVFVYTPILFGEDVQFEEHIFQMGWFNHQPVIVQAIFSIDPDLQPFNTLEFGPAEFCWTKMLGPNSL